MRHGRCPAGRAGIGIELARGFRRMLLRRSERLLRIGDLAQGSLGGTSKRRLGSPSASAERDRQAHGHRAAANWWARGTHERRVLPNGMRNMQRAITELGGNVS